MLKVEKEIEELRKANEKLIADADNGLTKLDDLKRGADAMREKLEDAKLQRSR